MDAVEYFRFVRDIPYRIPLSVHEPDHCCIGKHVALEALLASLGFKVRYAFCLWSWSNLDLPESLTEIPHEDRASHVYLEVYNREQERWMIVDATWDKKLASKLKVSEWDGRSDTTIAVKPVKILEERRDHFDRPSEAQWMEFMRVNGRFFEAFNRWLESVRAQT